MAKAPQTSPKATNSSKSAVANRTAARSTVKPPMAEEKTEEQIIAEKAAAFAAKLSQFKLDVDHLVEPGEEFISITPNKDIKFAVYRGTQLWTSVLTVQGEVVGIVRSEKSQANIYSLIACAALRLFLQRKESAMQLVLKLAALLTNILPMTSKCDPVTVDIGYTYNGKPGYVMMTAEGRVVVGGLDDKDIAVHLDGFAAAYNRFNVTLAHSASHKAAMEAVFGDTFRK